MAGRALARGALDAFSKKLRRRCTSSLDRDVSLCQEPLSQGLLGEAVRARPADGQVSGSMATLLAPNGQQASCFPGEAVRCLFVFHGSPRESTFGAAALLRGHHYCLSSAKLRSTDNANPRAVLSRALPRYRLYSKHSDMRYWTGTTGIGI